MCTSCVFCIRPQVKIDTNKVKIKFVSENKPIVLVRYSTKNGIVLDTTQLVRGPLSINQPRNWVWMVLWPAFSIPLSDSFILDGVVVSSARGDPRWFGYADLNESDVTIDLTYLSESKAHERLVSFISKNKGKHVVIPIDLRTCFGLMLNYNKKVFVK